MSRPRVQTGLIGRARAPQRERGGTYLLVLSMGTVLTVIGLAIGISGRLAARTTAAERDRAESGVLAASGAELALATINSEEKWRVVRANNTWSAAVPLGDGTIGWKLRDESDDDLADNFAEQVRIEGEAAVGQSRRRYSIVAEPRPTTALPVLACTLHSETSLTVSKPLYSSGGPASTDGLLTNADAITGDVHAGSVLNTGTIAGFVTTPAPNKVVPGSSAFDYYKQQATEILYGNLNGGNIKDCVLSKDSNPYGAKSAIGVYFIRVPTGKAMDIDDSILQATLVVDLQGTGQIKVRDRVFWEPPAQGFPSLVANGSVTGLVTVQPVSGTVTVPIIGINLLGIPVVIGTQASAPSELRGLFHVMGGTPAILENETKLIGCWINDGPVTIKNPTFLIAEPNLLVNPPAGYTRYDTSLTAVPGSFRWTPR